MNPPGNSGGRKPRSRVNPQAEEAALACVHRGRRHEALQILVKAYGDPLVGFAVRIVRDVELAKDASQQALLEAFQGLDKFQARSSFWSWLCGITKNRCIDMIRKGKRTDYIDDLDFAVLREPGGLPAQAMDPEQLTRRRALEHCLSKLPEAARTQLLMRFHAGYSFVEIGEAIGEPQGTVQVRMARIAARLLECLRKKGVTR
jgi:RNA polymerase sigma-70 factor (ECF subfamily)